MYHEQGFKNWSVVLMSFRVSNIPSVFSRARAPDQMTHEMQCGVRTRVISKEVGNGDCSQISPACNNNHQSLKRFILSCTGFGKSFIAKFRVVPAVRGGITQPWNQTFAERCINHGYGCSFSQPCARFTQPRTHFLSIFS